MPPESLPRHVVRYVVAVAVVGASVLVGALVHAALAPPAGWAWLYPPLVAAAIFVTQRRALVFHFRGHRTTNVFDEPAVALAFLLLPVGAALLSLAVGLAAAQVAARRRLVKATYNFAAYTIGAALAGLAFAGLLLAGAPVFVAALAPALVYPLVANVLLAGLFARLEGGSATAIFRERLLEQQLLNTALGAGIVLCGVALWSLHPVALLGLAPFALLARSFIDLHARAEREGRVRARLEEVTVSLLSPAPIDDVAETLLECCGELFLAGEATLVLDGLGAPGRTWTRTFEGGPVRRRAIEAPLVGHRGDHIGVLTIAPTQRAPNANALELDRPLMNVLARQVAAALEVAHAFQALVALKNEHEGIVRSVPAGILRLDARGDVIRWNERFARDVGEPRAAWAALRTTPALEARLGGLLRGERFADVELEIDGQVYAVSGEPQRDDEPGGVLLFHDVSARRDAARAMRSNVVARSLVRRIVLDLVGGIGASEATITKLGRRLAEEVDAPDAAAYSAEFRAMGLGDLRVTAAQDGTYVFEADDLLERRARSTQPTCHLARGYLEGAVGALHGRAALGAEVRCQSQGHERCRFVVKPRDEVVPVARRARRVDSRQSAP